MEKQLVSRAATARVGKYRTGGYGQIGVYRVSHTVLVNDHKFFGQEIIEDVPSNSV